ncbi:MAG: cysteine--tRNA ligase [bacterium]
MEVYNTLTRRMETFVPIDAGRVKIYTCGPTVYWFAHAGNFRAYVFADSLRRAFEYSGLQVRHVMNITDVGHLTTDDDLGEDKLEAGARREGKTPEEIAQFYESAFFRDAGKLNILRPHFVCRATDHIGEMIELIKRIEKNGFAYKTQVGLIFDTGKYHDYWRLGRLNLEEQRAGARVAVDPERKNPSDFALWITNQPKHLMQWDSPWGRGFPGWHIECSAMSMRYLGEDFDIHTGGIDHIPVHHTNERAQNFAATGREVVRYWMHNAFLQVGDTRMGKSEGNIVTIAELEEQGFEPLAFRYLCYTAHYRMPLNFTSEALSAAQNSLRGLRELGLNAQCWGAGEERDWLDRARAEFNSALEDDLNMPQALAVVWNLVREGNKRQDRRAWELLLDFDRVLGFGLREMNRDEDIPAEVTKLADERESARKAKNWAEADRLREEIKRRGWIVEDTLNGWRLKRLT